MEELKNYGHQHPLLMLNEEQLIGNGNGVVDCSRCGEKVSAPCFSCAECCGFYLHKTCAETPLELNHPFHRHHPLVLLQNPPSTSDTRNLEELEHVALEDSSFSSKNDGGNLGKCFVCWEPLAIYTYFSFDCGFNLRKKCAELPPKMGHVCHRKHPLLLQFNSERLSCKICQVTPDRGLVYGCSPCKLAIHIDCASPLQFIEDKSHQRPFTLFWRRIPFICDACGTEGHRVAYICVVDTEHGSYFCADCNVIFHVNCALKENLWYYIVSQENEDDKSLDVPVNSITKVLERNDAGEATLIEHCKHKHYLMLSDKISKHGDKCCDGCLLLISAKFYHCLRCDFFLHKSCAELPKMELILDHHCVGKPFSGLKPFILTSDCMFQCDQWRYLSNGFSYKCRCGYQMCVRCVILQCEVKIPGHKHPLLFYYDYKEQCNGCGTDINKAYRCKDCNFGLCFYCVQRPTRVRHNCNDDPLKLTYHKINDYVKYHYCDICEEKKDPKYWFYHCETCDTSAHVDCVLGEYPLIKLRNIYNEGDHPHPLTFAKKFPYYPKCVECGEPCEDLSLEFAEPGCNYIAHWKCRK
ncbi:hypothetical protein GOBAR_AA37035 [Gossypium barbadense]|uniref:DC1 domain-containing protein n=1 Tax=Gossypium barbadense TaxID=3634 RepID=A0A2P5VXW1_GOSBA|nr:hypothetical protein GOBAR_AA37035 [Gossypium barbadense]